MAQQRYFNYTTITTSGNTWRRWEKILQDDGIPALEQRGGKRYGMWGPLCGLSVAVSSPT